MSHPLYKLSLASAEEVVIFLHGSGDSGQGIADWLQELMPRGSSGNTLFVCPTAPLVPYTLSGGDLSRVWHDRAELSYEGGEDCVGIDRMTGKLKALVEQIVHSGVNRESIFLGGFSQGGHLSLHAVLREDGIKGIY